MENFDQILDAPAEEKVQLEYAGFWIRVGAYIIDAIILGIINFMLGLIFIGLDSLWVARLISIFIGFTYFSLMEASQYQATLGKLAVGIKVGDEDGDTISLGNAMGRYLGKIISALILCIGFMMVGWDDRKQGIHDKIANTFVYYKKPLYTIR